MIHMPESDRPLLLCIASDSLLTRLTRAGEAMAVQLEQVQVTDIEHLLARQPGARFLVCQDDGEFAAIVAQCERRRISTQAALVRLVDGSDYASCVATASICRAINIPASDHRLAEILQQLLDRSPPALPSDDAEDSIVEPRKPTLLANPPSVQPTPEFPGAAFATPGHAAPVIADVNHEIYATARRIAPAEVDVVLVGETGTGKDWLAHYIHDHSGSRGPFIAVNCPAIPETLAEAELFGVDAGAYTGATKSRAGRIESANGGTLYLDEIDSMPLTLQAKLLRVLQDRGVERVGSTVFRQLSFRVIVSTKIPLAKLVEQGKFRTDLYYRLSVVELALPLLRSQPARALELFWRYVEHAQTRYRTTTAGAVNPAIEAQILAHRWEGNIRELRAAAQRYALGFPVIAGNDTATQGSSLKELLHQYERALLVAALERCQRNVARAARELSVEPHVLYYKLKTLGIHIATRSDQEAASAGTPALLTIGRVEARSKPRTVR
jgi:DNA-binding NtrC family response regulator